MSTILGVHSPKLDALRALRTKTGRAEAGRYAVEGTTLLAEALAAGLLPESVFATEGGTAALAALGPATRLLDDRTFTIPDRAMARVSDLETPPGIVAVFPIVLDEPAALFDGSPILVLAGIGDPGNAGTLLRAAEIFGIARAVFTADAVEPHNPKVVRATMGALFRMRLGRATGAALVAAAADANYTIVAASREGEPLPEFRFPGRVAIAIGNERHGVAASLPKWDRSVAIPQRGGGESLNAAVAGGIIFYAFSQAADVSQTLENP